MFTSDDGKSRRNRDFGEMPIFQSIGAIREWFESAAAQLTTDDLEGRVRLKDQYVKEISKLYERLEQELKRPMSAEERAELMEDLQLLTKS